MSVRLGRPKRLQSGLIWQPIFAGGRLAGSITWRRERRREHVSDLGLMADEIGRGAGTTAMRRYEAAARRRGSSAIVLESPGGPDAERLYRRLGYRRRGFDMEKRLRPTP